MATNEDIIAYDAFGNMTQAAVPEGTINYTFDPATPLHTETWTATSHSPVTTDSRW
jgi:hypothetical protein